MWPSQLVVPDSQQQDAAWNELRPVLHDEVRRLPAKYRIPVILSYLEGKTNEEVAEILQWPVGAVKGRLSRARALLRSRLARRGMAVSAAILLTVLTNTAVFAEVVPVELVMRIVRRVRSARPQPFPVYPRSGTSPESNESSVPPRVELMTKNARACRKLGIRGLVFLILVMSVSAIVGIGLAARRRLASSFPRSNASVIPVMNPEPFRQLSEKRQNRVATPRH
jgi:hypothetical protein